MRPRLQNRPLWARKQLASLEAHGTTPLASSALRLRLKWLVFEDPLGNFVIVDPDRPRPLGAYREAPRLPTLYMATTNLEASACAEAMLPWLEQNLIGGQRQMALLDRVRDARRRLEGFTPETRLPKVRQAA